MRIVAGERKGARLAAPRGRDTRPTSDRVRESLFSLLGDVTGARVLDPFAGSGALGLEALSRGAAHADLCDVDRAALAALRENAARLRYADRCTIRRQDARRRLAADRAAGGTYDPVTSGHLDIITRAAAIFDRVIVAVVRAPQHKRTMFSLEDRITFIEESLGDAPNVTVEGFATLVVEFARERGARSIVKGLRAVSDFEWEFQMNNLNRGMAPEIETMYLMASPEYSFLSSRGVREIASFGGSVAEYVPGPVARRLAELHAAGEL